MQFIASLNYSPVGTLHGALTAPITLNFATDNNWTVGFHSTFQGDQVLAQTLKVDNSGNNTPITYNNGATSSVIPAYSMGYIDIRTFYGMSFNCVNGVSVNMEVLNYYVPPGFSPSSNVANSLTNDPFFSKVIGLYHFQTQQGSFSATNFQDSSKNGFGTITPTNNIGNFAIGTNTTKPLFGINEPTINGGGTGNTSSAANSISLAGTFTIEFAVYPVTVTASEFLNFTTSGAVKNVTFTAQSNGYGMAINNNGNTNNVFCRGLNGSNPPTNAWSFLAFVNTGNHLYAYFNGTCVADTVMNNQCIAEAVTMNFISGTSLFYIGELRITNDIRYTSNFTAQSAPWLNQ